MAGWRDVTACNENDTYTCKWLARGLEVAKYGAEGGEAGGARAGGKRGRGGGRWGTEGSNEGGAAER